MTSESPSTLYLVDGSGQFHRAYHAIRGLATSRGLPTNATYGFTTAAMMMPALGEFDIAMGRAKTAEDE